MAAVSTFPDYCLSCDRQIEGAGEVYCSQQCRLADLCISPSSSSSNSSMPPTPMGVSHQSQSSAPANSRRHPSSSVSSSSSLGQSRHSSHAFVLPPAYDFSSHRHSTASSASTSSVISIASSQRSANSIAAAPRPPSGYFAYAGSGNMLLSTSEAARKTLSPTSSRSSITSSVDDARNELRAYESGFDVTRDWRRRRASVYDSAWRN